MIHDNAFDLEVLVLGDLPYNAYSNDDDERRPSDDPKGPSDGRRRTRYPAPEVREPVQVKIKVRRITSRWPLPRTRVQPGTVVPIPVGHMSVEVLRQSLMDVMVANPIRLLGVRTTGQVPRARLTVGVQTWSQARIAEDDEEIMELLR